MVINIVHLVLYFFMALRPNAGHGLPIHYVSRTHTTTHHSRQDSSGRMISPLQKPVLDNTHKRQTSMPPGGIRTHNFSRRQTADLCVRPRGHCYRHLVLLGQCNEMVQFHLSFLWGQNQVEMSQSEINSTNQLTNVVNLKGAIPMCMVNYLLYQCRRYSF